MPRKTMNAQVKLNTELNKLQHIAVNFPHSTKDEHEIILGLLQHFENSMNKFEIMATNRRGHVQTGDAIIFGVVRIAKEMADEVSAPLKDLLSVWVKDRWRNQEVHQNRVHQLFKVFCASKIDSDDEIEQVMATVMDFFIYPQKELVAQLSEATVDGLPIALQNVFSELNYLPTNQEVLWESPFRFPIYMNIANVIIGFGTDSLIVKRYFDEFHGAIETLQDLYDYHEFFKEFNYRNTLNASEKARLMVNFLNQTAKTKLLMSMNHNRIGFMPLFRNFRDSTIWDDDQWVLKQGQPVKNYTSQVFLTKESYQYALSKPKAFVDFFADPNDENIEACHHANVIFLEMYLQNPSYLILIKGLQCVLLKDLTLKLMAEFSYHDPKDLELVSNLLVALHTANADLHTQKSVLSSLLEAIQNNIDFKTLMSDPSTLIINALQISADK